VTPQHILGYLDRIECLAGSFIPTDRALAEALGMKPSTVNRLVLQLIAEGHIEPCGRKRKRIARENTPHSKRYRIMALASARDLRHALQEGATGFPIDLDLPDFRNRPEARAHLVRQLQSPCDGLVVWPKIEDALLAELVQNGIRVVQMGAPANPTIHNISANMSGALQMALSHLRSCGHTEIGCINTGPNNQDARLIREYQSIASSEFSKASAKRISWVNARDHDRLESDLKRWMRGRSPITAVVTRQASLARSLLGIMKRSKLRVPEDLSVISIGSDPLKAAGFKTHVTCCYFSMVDQVKVAFSLLMTLLNPACGDFSRPCGILIQPSFREDGTVSNRLRDEPVQSQPAKLPSLAWPLDFEERRRSLRSRNFGTYEFLGRAIGLRQEPLDLRHVMNRNSRGRRSWLPNHPFAHLPDGDTIIHGIRFEILKAAAASPNFLHLAGLQTGPNNLPGNAEASLNCRADYLCFLHACGFAPHGEEIGGYRIFYARGQPVVIPLIAQGRNSDAAKSGANIQDWWPELPPIQGDTFRQFVLTGEGEDPFEYERSLYSLVWKNPHPKRRIRAVEIFLLPNTRAHLALFAMTCLRQT